MRNICLLSFVFLFSSISSSCSRLSTESNPIPKTITVGLTGQADFNRIQDAVDSVPDFTTQWIKIHIKPGTYREKVKIGGNKGFIVLEGEGAQNTIIEWGDHVVFPGHVASGDTATFCSLAHNVVLVGITFKNTHVSTTPADVGVAALIGGDKTSVYSCSFIGIQDTLADQSGRHYFRDSYIEGAVDIIFGFAQSIYEGCVISTVPSLEGIGYVTAQGRNSNDDMSAFVFKSCNLTGSGKTYLGRGWRTYSRVLFYQTYMGGIVVPEGWRSWYADGNGSLTTFAEFDCSGPGSDTSGRVRWEKQLSDDTVKHLTDLSFVNSDGWLQQQPDGFRKNS